MTALTRDAAGPRASARIAIASLLVLALMVSEAWGAWWRVAAIVALHLGHIALVAFVHPWWDAHRRRSTDALLAGAHGLLTIATAHAAHWSIGSWLLVPLNVLAGLAYEEAETRLQVGAFLAVTTVVAALDGATPVRIVWVVSLTALIFLVWEGRAGVLREALAALEASRRMEIELRQAQKLEAIGRLAAGVAHQINSPMQYVGDSARLLAELVEGEATWRARATEVLAPEARERLARLEAELDLGYLRAEGPAAVERALAGVERVATLVQSMREFAHPGETGMAPADLNRAVQATVEIARGEWRDVADLELNLGPLPPVVCHVADLNQVVLNLVVNAAHAIGDAAGRRGRGVIRVATRQEGQEVVLTVADSGDGIPSAIRDRVFEPFFTTKEVGRGTGQGLAIARAAVLRHGGAIRFDTEVGAGTTFTVRIPVEGKPAATS